MCGISGAASLKRERIQSLSKKISWMNKLIAHRGPDGEGVWCNDAESVGFGHKRLSILDLNGGAQPMSNENGFTICFNGEIYNYIELKKELFEYRFRTNSDTEVLLAAYQKWGKDCLNKLRGMFAFAIWDDKEQTLFCARDQFGIKPFYYTIQNSVLYFSSEAKGLLPFVKDIKTDPEALKEYLVFQLYLGEKTLFEGINQLEPGHYIEVKCGEVFKKRYWEVSYELDFHHTSAYFEEKLRYLMDQSVELHTRSDVPIGVYVSGGFDSGVVAALASRHRPSDLLGFTGKFSKEGNDFDESPYARCIAEKYGLSLYEEDISAKDFINDIEKIIYHLDYPVAGPGSFAQYGVSRLASKHRKVVLGGQGGDEIFGGYTRYLIAYFEQCIKGAIEGTLHSGNFIVTYESIIKNLQALSTYKPMIQEFFSKGMFEPLDKRYYHLINRAPQMTDFINHEALGGVDLFATFQRVFNGDNVQRGSYFDKMTHFDFKTLLPALLQVEDRMSMAWGLESRVPFINVDIVEFAARIPPDVKFKDGTLKRLLVHSMSSHLPDEVNNRKTKMGFPVPLTTWMRGEAREFMMDIFASASTKNRDFVMFDKVSAVMEKESKFGRSVWGLLSLECWHRAFHDKASDYRFKE
nr:asparagine synthase (glutamine-hydrolyzing) [Bdellovibrio sp. CKG001]